MCGCVVDRASNPTVLTGSVLCSSGCLFDVCAVRTDRRARADAALLHRAAGAELPAALCAANRAQGQAACGCALRADAGRAAAVQVSCCYARRWSAGPFEASDACIPLLCSRSVRSRRWHALLIPSCVCSRSYQQVTQSVLSYLQCVDVGAKKVVFSVPAIDCSSGQVRDSVFADLLLLVACACLGLCA
jgi:hypothetical protein